MKAFIILSPLLAGVSVSAYSELLRGNPFQPRRLDGAKCTTSADCNDNGRCEDVQTNPAGNDIINSGRCDCNGQWSGDDCGSSCDCSGNGSCDTSDSSGSCDCDWGYLGTSCDNSADISIVTLVASIGNSERSLELCSIILDDFVYRVHDRRRKELRHFPSMVAADCDENIGSAALEKAVMEGPSLRHLKKSKKSKRDSREEFVVTGMGFVARSNVENVHCVSEIGIAMRNLEDDLSVSELDNLDETVIVLGPSQCDHEIIEEIVKNAVSTSSSSRSSSSR